MGKNCALGLEYKLFWTQSGQTAVNFIVQKWEIKLEAIVSDENCWLEKKQLIGSDCIGEQIHLMYIVQCYCKSINL